MADADVHRNLLFGVLRLQTLYQADLIAAFHAWSTDKAKPLDRVLVDECTGRGDTRVVEAPGG